MEVEFHKFCFIIHVVFHRERFIITISCDLTLNLGKAQLVLESLLESGFPSAWSAFGFSFECADVYSGRILVIRHVLRYNDGNQAPACERGRLG